MLSSDESTCNVGSGDSNKSSDDDDVRSLSPDEILVSSDESDVEESKIPHPPDSDVSVNSDDIEFLQETSSESDGEHDEPINYKHKLDKYHSY